MDKQKTGCSDSHVCPDLHHGHRLEAFSRAQTLHETDGKVRLASVSGPFVDHDGLLSCIHARLMVALDNRDLPATSSC
jgi:hypothetical protein